MKYASEVWSPHYKIDIIENLEEVQRFAMRVVCLRTVGSNAR